MRTTVEITDEHRAKLLEAAARRGEKGFSSIVREALAQYFAAEQLQEDKVRNAIDVIGALDADTAEEMHESVRRLRATWR